MSDGQMFMERLESLMLPGESEQGLAKRIGVRHQTLRDWKLLRDAGRDFCPRIKTIRSVAQNLNVPVEWLLLGVGEK